jgi:hypothetical protein
VFTSRSRSDVEALHFARRRVNASKGDAADRILIPRGNQQPARWRCVRAGEHRELVVEVLKAEVVKELSRVSEPAAGSDAFGSMRTVAKPNEAGGYVLHAEIVGVLAK